LNAGCDIVIRMNLSNVRTRNPTVTNLHIDALDGGPGNAVRSFLLARISRVVRECMIERGAIDILRVRRQVTADRGWKISVGLVRH